MLKAINIKWDTDGDKEVLNILPPAMIIPDALELIYKKDKQYALEEISDWLSATIGFCHDGFELQKEITKEAVLDELLDFFNNKMETGDAPEIIGVITTNDNGIVIDCVGGKHIRLNIQVN